MREESDETLLLRYARERDEAAFGVLLNRHAGLVYSAARRLALDLQWAEDVTQAVFVALATQAAEVGARVGAGMPLSAWLHVTTRNQAAKTIRGEVRRRVRETTAMDRMTLGDESGKERVWDALAPVLDDALGDLSERDRNALLLRYFENRTAREVGERLGLTEEAAQKRLTRALDRLRDVFISRGVTVSVAALVGALSTEAVRSAPAGLALSIQGAIAKAMLSGATVAGGGAVVGVEGAGMMGAGVVGGAKTVAIMTTSKGMGLVATSVVIGLMGWSWHQQGQVHRLKEELSRLQRASGEGSVAVGTPIEAAGTGENQAMKQEVMRLRAEVARLERERIELERERRGARNPAAAAVENPAEPPDAAQEAALQATKAMGILKMISAKRFSVALVEYAGKNNGQFPATLEQAISDSGDADADGVSLSQFELLYSGRLQAITTPQNTIVLREREPFVVPGKPGLSRTYGFADGHSEIRFSADGDFEAWETERMLPTGK